MRNETTKRILSETSQETIDKVKKTADELVHAKCDKLSTCCEQCYREFKDWVNGKKS